MPNPSGGIVIAERLGDTPVEVLDVFFFGIGPSLVADYEDYEYIVSGLDPRANEKWELVLIDAEAWLEPTLTTVKESLSTKTPADINKAPGVMIATPCLEAWEQMSIRRTAKLDAYTNLSDKWTYPDGSRETLNILRSGWNWVADVRLPVSGSQIRFKQDMIQSRPILANRMPGQRIGAMAETSSPRQFTTYTDVENPLPDFPPSNVRGVITSATKDQVLEKAWIKCVEWNGSRVITKGSGVVSLFAPIQVNRARQDKATHQVDQGRAYFHYRFLSALNLSDILPLLPLYQTR